MLKYIDAHCHILSASQMHDAVARGVGRFVVNATVPNDWYAVVDLASRDNVYGAIGVHPWFATSVADDWESQMRDILARNPNLMVGEIGLDSHRDNLATQEVIFRTQLQIAHDFGRVAHIHIVGAWGRCMEILRESDLPPAMVFHAFSGSVDIMRELVAMNAYFSFGCAVYDARRVHLRLSVAAAPLNRILVESDTPDGCDSVKIPDIVAEIARIRGESVEHTADTIYNNTMGLLNDKSV